MDPNSGKIYMVPEGAKGPPGTVPVPNAHAEAAELAAEFAAFGLASRKGASLFHSKDLEARKWAKRQADKVKNRKRAKIAKASKKRNR